MKTKVYFSHYIRGLKGDAYNDEEQNLRGAMFQGNFFRRLFPEQLDIYIPAEHETIMRKFIALDQYDIDDALKIDCAIIDDCEVVIFFAPGGELSEGMKIEKDHAEAEGKIIYEYQQLTHTVIADVYNIIQDGVV